MANLNLSEFTEKLFVADADHTFIWDTAASISKRVSRNSWLNSGTLTSDAPVTISQTWSTTGTYTAAKVNVTETATANNFSRLLDLQVGGVSLANFSKAGHLIFPSSSAVTPSGPGVGQWVGTLGLFGSGGSLLVTGSGAALNISSNVVLSWNNDTILLRDGAANTLALRNGAAAQTFNVYGTYTSITDYKRLSLSCSATTGNATIGVPFNSVLAVTGGSSPSTTATITFATQAAAFPVGSSVVVAGVTPSGYNGTYVVTASTTSSVSYTVGGALAAWSSGGTATVSGSANWVLQSSGNLLAGTDNAYDIGASGANRPRNVYVASQLAVGTFATFGSYIYAENYYFSTTKGLLAAPSDGVFTFSNRAATDFNRLQFGGTTNLFPAIKRSTTYLQARLADDSAFAPIQGKLTTDTAYTGTVVAATGYITIYDSTGTAYRVPCAL